MNKKKRNIIVIAVAVIIVVAILIFGGYLIKTLKEKPEPPENINEVTEVNLREKAWINSLTKISIENTEDYFEITEKVKWEVPDYPEGTTVSFSIAIPYTFVVDGKSYDGIYTLGDSEWNEKPEGLDYDLRITNLTKDGNIEVIVTK